MTKKRGLGSDRGLEALIGGLKKEQAFSADLQKNPKETLGKLKKSAQKTDTDDDVALIEIEIASLKSGKYQPRRNMNEASLAELSESIKRHGIMQPIVIRPLLANEKKADGITHEIIAGERRWRAAKMAGLTHIPAIHRKLSDELAIALALIENIQREDLNVLEQAEALQRFNTEFGMSHAMIAEVVGKARATVSNLLRLNALNEEVKDYINKGKLDMGHARALLSLSSAQQPVIAKKIIDGNMTTREAERLVKSILNPAPKQPKADNIEAQVSRQLSDKFGATVKLKKGKDGKGSMEILFFSDEELNAILTQMGVVL